MGKRLKNSSIFYKIAAFYMLFITVAILVTSVLFVRENLSLLKERETVVGKTNLSIATDYFQKKYNMIYNLSNYIHSGDISRIMSRINEDPEQSRDYANISVILDFFRGIAAADSEIEDVILVTKGNSVFSYTVEGLGEVRPSYPFVENGLIHSLEEGEEDIRIYRENPSAYTLRDRSDDVISFAGKIFDASRFPYRKEVGFFIINCSSAALNGHLMHEDWDGLGLLTAINAQGQLLFSSDEQYPEDGNEENSVKAEQAFEESRRAGTSGITVSFSLSQQVFRDRWRLMGIRVLASVLGAGVLLILFSMIITRIFRKKIWNLQLGMKAVEEGNFHVRVPASQEDEIGQITRSFNEMCDRLNTYVNLVYQAEIEQKNAQINALQAQINPHFLYNTLESIKAQAIRAGDRQTADMICLLGDLFRLSSNFTDRIVYLEDELEYCRTYLELMNFRMDGSIELGIDVPEDYLAYGIPKLILQPVIENTVIHGFSERDGKKLVGIVVKKRDQNLELTLYDNGMGITKEKLEQISHTLNEASSGYPQGGIGVRNVHNRLRLMFGEPYGLKINSIEDMGTAIKIMLPAMVKKEMEEYVQASFGR